MKVVVGGGPLEDAEAFVRAWESAERGAPVAERVLSFESWDGLTAILTGDRYRLLRHLHATPEKSVSALAHSLGRRYRSVRSDIAALEDAGLVERGPHGVRATADAIRTEIRL